MSFSKLFHRCSLFTLLVIVGCSGSDDSTSSDAGSGDSPPSAPAVSAPGTGANAGGDVAGDPAAMADDAAMDPGSGPPMGMMTPGGNPTRQMARQAIPRPANPLQWTSQHIKAAIEERDPKVVAALAAYADDHKGVDQSAQEVVAWLQILNEPAVNVSNPNSGSYRPGGSGYPDPGGAGYGNESPGPAGGHGGSSDADISGAGTIPGPAGGHGDPADVGIAGAGTVPGSAPGPAGGHGDPADVGIAGAGTVPGSAPGPAGGHGDASNPTGGSYPSYAPGLGRVENGPASAVDPALYDGGMTPGASGGQRSQGRSANDEQIAVALIDTLLSIHSLTSYQAARNLLEGELELPFAPEQLVGWTMTSLIKHIEGPHDPAAKILQQAIQQPELVRSGSGDFDASRLKDLALQEHWTSAVAVIDGLMGLQSSSLSPSGRRNRNNYGGEGYNNDGGMYDPATAGGADAYPEGPPGSNPGAQNNQPQGKNTNEVNPVPENLTLVNFTQKQALAASQYLWSPELVKEVSQRLSESETLMKDPPLLLLAGQLPATPTRYAFQQFLETNWRMNDDWTRNPSSFVRYDIFSKYLRDPGLVVTLKHLPREQQTNQNNNGGAGGEYGGAAPQPNNNRQQNPEMQREQQIKHLWFDTSRKFTLALMDRMLAAARGNHLPKSNLDELGIKLHRNASLTVDSRLELAIGEASADPAQDTRDKTTVNYIRIESPEIGRQEAQRITNHYKSALRKEQEFMILNNNGMWLSAPVNEDRKTGELVSIDVLLSIKNVRPTVSGNNQQRRSNDIANLAPGPEYGGQGGGQENQTFVIEILVVRIPNPEIFLQPPGQAVSEN